MEKKVDYPTEHQISQRAFDLFFQERDAPKVFDEYRRRAEDELLERAFQALARRAPNGGFPPGR